MADRRMFHKNVVESDAFLDMPQSVQLLYFHICMYADDDGFINGPRRIARQVGCGNEELQELINNRFLLAFENGVVVIKHWRMANSLKSDRVKMPQYPELAAKIFIKENRSYTDHQTEGAVSLLEHKSQYMDSKGNPNGIPVEENRNEKNISEGNRAEAKCNGFQPGDAAATADSKVDVIGGELGKGVVFLSDDQFSDLLDKMSLETFDHYMDKLSTFIINNNAHIKNHYETILKWWREDGAVAG